MHSAWITAAALAALGLGCGESAEPLGPGDVGYTTGGEGKPVGPSRIARPLPEAGPRVNYPDPDHFDIAADTGDPMMEQTPPVMAGNCPARMGGVEVEVTDVYDGAAILVLGAPPQAATIQASARNMVGAEELEGEPAVADAAAPDEEMGKPDAIAMPATRTEVVDLARGVRISWFAENPDDVIEVRNSVRRLAAAMQSGICPPTE